MQRLLSKFIAFTLCFLWFCAPSIAQETIRSFHSLLQVQKDGSFMVSETIVVKAEGRKIKRGIFRDFPLYFEDEKGKRRKVGFELISVTRDHQVENTRIEDRGEYLRIYIGQKEHFLKPGVYEYIIKYKTDRQLRYFDTHDEVYWNATGNFWDFPIEKVLAQVVLPEGGAATDWDVFTGRVGSTAKDATIGKIAGKRVIKYRTTKVLQPGEGMTVLAKLPKGLVDPPSAEQKHAWFWADNKALITGTAFLILITFYYFIVWWKIGRDIPHGVIIPRWKAPDGISPALVNYIDQKGLSGKGFDAISSAILSLAVKGYVKLSREYDDLSVEFRHDYTSGELPIGEQAVLDSVIGRAGGKLVVNSANGKKVKSLQTSFSSAMEKEHRNKFYEHNTIWVVFGVFLSLIGILFVLLTADLSEDAWGTLFALGVFTFMISIFAFSIGKHFLSSGGLGQKIGAIVAAGFFTFTLLSAGYSLIGDIANIILENQLIAIFMIGIIVLNVLFYFLLGAPTKLGRKRMDEIEGLKTYLTLAEKDRMNMAEAPDFSSEHYEELLPYAVALGVEKPWSKSFETWLAAAVAAGAVASTYSPGWYHGRWRSDDLSDSMGDLSNSMQSDFSSSMPAPQSSSSGFSSGGGFSGGGGGGGGGGGW